MCTIKKIEVNPPVNFPPPPPLPPLRTQTHTFHYCLSHLQTSHSIAPISPNLETFAISESNNSTNYFSRNFSRNFCFIMGEDVRRVWASFRITRTRPSTPQRFLSPRTRCELMHFASSSSSFQSHTIYRKEGPVLAPSKVGGTHLGTCVLKSQEVGKVSDPEAVKSQN